MRFSRYYVVLLCMVLLCQCINTICAHDHTKKKNIENILDFIPQAHTLSQSTDADWLVVGAGPAGIVTVGVLLDIGISEKRITWLDPEFAVGRIGQYYGAVPANNNIQGFINFLNACKVFQECGAPSVQNLKNLDPYAFDNLGIIVEPLQCITEYIRTKVNSVQGSMTGLHFNNDIWMVSSTDNQVIRATHVILATGSHPKTLPYEQNKIIPLDLALNPANLEAMLTQQDIVGVVGSSHSAILLLKYLSLMPVQHIYNFYRYPLLYAVDMGTWIMNEITGLKGLTAQWAKNVLEINPPHNLTRIKIEPQTLEQMLPLCSKIIYAIGYEPNTLPDIHNDNTNEHKPATIYNETTGFIAPRLFGIGIAFPEKYIDEGGQSAHCIGLGCFMEYAQNMIPLWANHSISKHVKWQMARAQYTKFKKMEQLFTICIL